MSEIEEKVLAESWQAMFHRITLNDLLNTALNRPDLFAAHAAALRNHGMISQEEYEIVTTPV